MSDVPVVMQRKRRSLETAVETRSAKKLRLGRESLGGPSSEPASAIAVPQFKQVSHIFDDDRSSQASLYTPSKASRASTPVSCVRSTGGVTPLNHADIKLKRPTPRRSSFASPPPARGIAELTQANLLSHTGNTPAASHVHSFLSPQPAMSVSSGAFAPARQLAVTSEVALVLNNALPTPATVSPVAVTTAAATPKPKRSRVAAAYVFVLMPFTVLALFLSLWPRRQLLGEHNQPGEVPHLPRCSLALPQRALDALQEDVVQLYRSVLRDTNAEEMVLSLPRFNEDGKSSRASDNPRSVQLEQSFALLAHSLDADLAHTAANRDAPLETTSMAAIISKSVSQSALNALNTSWLRSELLFDRPSAQELLQEMHFQPAAVSPQSLRLNHHQEMACKLNELSHSILNYARPRTAAEGLGDASEVTKVRAKVAEANASDDVGHDYASAPRGGKVVAAHTTYCFGASSNERSLFQSLRNTFKLACKPSIQTMVAYAPIRSGHCYCIAGHRGQVTVSLHAPVHLRAVELQHWLQTAEDSGAAMLDFEVVGFVESLQQPSHHLGRFSFDAVRHRPMAAGGIAVKQQFQLAHLWNGTSSSLPPFKFLQISYTSNHGAESTCVYRIAAFGLLSIV